MQHFRHSAAFRGSFRQMIADRARLGKRANRRGHAVEDILKSVFENRHVRTDLTLPELRHELQPHVGQPLEIVVHDSLDH